MDMTSSQMRGQVENLAWHQLVVVATLCETVDLLTP